MAGAASTSGSRTCWRDARRKRPLLGAGEALLERVEAALEPAEEGLRERTVAALLDGLGEARFEAARRNGPSSAPRRRSSWQRGERKISAAAPSFPEKDVHESTTR